MNDLLEHAKYELTLAGFYDKDSDYEGEIPKAVLALLSVFSEQDHSGGSAALVINLFQNLAKFQNISPLTGEDHEWIEVSNGVFQNKRCYHVFKQKDRFEGQAYDLDAIVFENENGMRWTGLEGARPIVFPYTPTTEIKKV